MRLKQVHYGWVMVLTAVGVLATQALIFYSFGIFLRPVTMEFHWERGALSAAVSIGMLVSGPLSILSGRLSDRHGPRVLVTISGLLTGIGFLLMSQISLLWQAYLVYGVIIAIGGSCCIVPITTTIPRWFATKRGMAMGLAWTGIGLGGTIAPVLTQWVISGYGWRLGYVTLGIINLIVVTLLAQLMKRSPQQMGVRPFGENEAAGSKEPLAEAVEGLTFQQAVKTGRFWLFSLLMVCFIFTVQVIMAHIAPHIIDTGITATIAASIVSIFAATSLIGRNLAGLVSDKVGSRLTMTACLSMVTAVMVWLLFSSDVWMFYLFAVVYGIAYGGVVPLQTLLAGELFGIRFLGMIMATTMFVGSVGGAIGAPLAGSIFDATGSYRSAFLICVALCGLALILSLILLRSKVKGTQAPLNHQDMSNSAIIGSGLNRVNGGIK